MGCLHPMGVERVYRADGRPGVRCPVCRKAVYPGDPLLVRIKRVLARKGKT